MEALLEAAKSNKVKRIVVTLSLVNMTGGHKASIDNNQKIYTEKDFAAVEFVTDPYQKSKVVQELCIWQYQR